MKQSVCAMAAVAAAGLLLAGGCGGGAASKPQGLTMDELAAQKRAPLEVVSFRSASGIGDSILGMALEAPEDVAVQRHVLTVSNVSDRAITAFRCLFTYTDANGQAVNTDNATTEAGYEGMLDDGIGPGQTAQLELHLATPRDTRAECRFAEIVYRDEGLGGIWNPAETTPDAEPDTQE